MKPVIGVTSNFGLDHDADPPRERSYLLAAYSEAVFAAGGMPHPLPVPGSYDGTRLDEMLATIDGLLLTGGFDLHPHHYGDTVHARANLLHVKRDRFEVDLFRAADACRIPMFAICLGMQVAHVVRGGRLHQHVDELGLEPMVVHHLPGDRNAFHPVRVESDARLARILGRPELEVSSRHHQIIDPQQPARGLRPAAWAPDGVLEASEDFSDGRFLLAVQWHPEDIFDRPEHLALFAAHVEAAAAWRTARDR